MSVKVSSWVWDHSRARGVTRLVLLALADHAGADGGDAYPSVARLAERCGVGERTVQDAIGRLVELGELVVDRQAGPRGANRYQIPMRGADAAPPGVQEPHPAPPQIPHPADPAPPQIPHPRGADPAPHPRRSRTPRGADPAPEPSFNRQEPSKEPSSLVLLDDPDAAPQPSFDDFWKLYPSRIDKRSSRTAWDRATKRATPAEIIAGVTRYLTDGRVLDGFVKNPTTWLNRDGWNDDPQPRRNGTTTTDRSRQHLETFADKARQYEQAITGQHALTTGGTP